MPISGLSGCEPMKFADFEPLSFSQSFEAVAEEIEWCFGITVMPYSYIKGKSENQGHLAVLLKTLPSPTDSMWSPCGLQVNPRSPCGL